MSLGTSGAVPFGLISRTGNMRTRVDKLTSFALLKDCTNFPSYLQSMKAPVILLEVLETFFVLLI